MSIYIISTKKRTDDVAVLVPLQHRVVLEGEDHLCVD